MKFIIGKKIEMTQIWKDGKVLAVTKVQAEPCTITQVKNEEKDGYRAVQVAFGKGKEKRTKKPQSGHLKKAGLKGVKVLKEFKIDDKAELNIGDLISADNFVAGDKIDITGISKGKGFAGVVKRHGFHGSKKTHGNKDQLRMPGSIGCTGPAHVFKGVRMAGRMGGEQVTTKNLEIADVDLENNILFIKGAVPGGRNGLVIVVADGELKVSKKEETKEEKKPEIDQKQEEKTEEGSENKEEKKESASEKTTDQEKKEASSAEANKEEKN
ncbi:50S ribosomal protein L3 [Candidatus Falkowbacteria bacterium]|nr:50S ribosomal protein L3 [Candidatus Falkowbacteria bacterium]